MISRMVRTRLKELLKERDKTLLSLAKETGISYNTLHKIKKSEVTAITFDVAEKICDNLKCGIGDLLTIEK